jgi:hypothetical protein
MIKVTDENLRKYIHLMGQDVTTRSYDNMEYVLREFLSDYSDKIVKEAVYMFENEKVEGIKNA